VKWVRLNFGFLSIAWTIVVALPAGRGSVTEIVAREVFCRARAASGRSDHVDYALLAEFFHRPRIRGVADAFIPMQLRAEVVNDTA